MILSLSIPKTKFRNDNNVRLLKALFFETANDKSTVVYTLKDHDHEGYPSLYRLYIEAEDILEYDFATTYLDGWEHWELLTACTWFEPYVSRWRYELELKIRSRALKNILEDSASESRSAAASNRFLVNGDWKPKDGKGRPSKADIKQAAREEAEHTNRLTQDFNRILPGASMAKPN